MIENKLSKFMFFLIIAVLMIDVILAAFTGVKAYKNGTVIKTELTNRESWKVTSMKYGEITEVRIYDWDSYMREQIWENPILVIRDSNGIHLFKNMLDNAHKISGILDVTAPPYIAEVDRKNDDMALILLYIGHTKKDNSYGGMYIDDSYTETGYRFVPKDLEAFFNAYPVLIIED